MSKKHESFNYFLSSPKILTGSNESRLPEKKYRKELRASVREFVGDTKRGIGELENFTINEGERIAKQENRSLLWEHVIPNMSGLPFIGWLGWQRKGDIVSLGDGHFICPKTQAEKTLARQVNAALNAYEWAMEQNESQEDTPQ